MIIKETESKPVIFDIVVFRLCPPSILETATLTLNLCVCERERESEERKIESNHT